MSAYNYEITQIAYDDDEGYPIDPSSLSVRSFGYGFYSNKSLNTVFDYMLSHKILLIRDKISVVS